ncbi:MAG: bifunctional [glutamate--ammonia ligase]-adenylyl-L-tyrosine phosphorylase/[glutamate--ammonia-ligase] adenylyltransferase, partial [Gammaproteobacteria bacterium]|nr:bifunctional [glutamate--ammonia ligase]-adenylyl-L-tyrosine phosphorylase/[glutamate--ammonia-ligase] adenylyltransferase [Gammaproteobacteria bacterium]
MHELLKTIPQDIAEQIAAKLEPVLVLADEDESFASHLAVQQAARVWAGSDFVINWCLRNQTAFKSLLESGDLQNAYTEDDYLTRLKEQCETDFNPDKKRIFRLFRNREMVRIAWRDLCGADLNETLRDLSLLAEACIDVGLKVVRENLLERFGYPQDSAAEEIPLVILAMGKLGAHELNYSSDIDLIFVYAEEGETQGGRRSTSHHEYFTHVARQFIDLLNSPTADGFVFRTDARLRPFGDSGSLVVSFNALENYYERHGREWERYALIKANILNARKSDKQELIARIKPFVFRRYLDYSVFDSLREMKDMIAKEVQRKGMDENVKLGPGGIREVEFIGQAFQMIRGGREPRLQARAIQPVLKTLAELNILADHIAKALLKGYDFLRKVENRIQAYADQQTHNLPQDEIQRRRLAFAMGFDNWPDFLRGLNKHRDKIHDAFEQVFVAPQADAPEPQSKAADNPYEGLWQGRMAEDEAASLLDQSGFENALNAVRLINALRDGSVCKSLSPRGRARLDRLMPMIIGAVAKLKGPDETLARL